MAMKSLHQLIPHRHNPVPRLSTNWPANRSPKAEETAAETAEPSPLAGTSSAITGIAFAFPCPECGEHYQLTLGQIILSQDDMACGCDARGENECQSVHYASLVDRSDIEDLVSAWTKIEAAVVAAGGQVGSAPVAEPGKEQPGEGAAQ